MRRKKVFWMVTVLVANAINISGTQLDVNQFRSEQKKLSESLTEYKKFYKKKSRLEELVETKNYSNKTLTQIKNAQQKVTHLVAMHQAIAQAEAAIAGAKDKTLAEEKKKKLADIKERFSKIEAKKNPRILSIIFLKTKVQSITKAFTETKY